MMQKPFEEALNELLASYAANTDSDELKSALELALYGLNEEDEDA